MQIMSKQRSGPFKYINTIWTKIPLLRKTEP